MSLRLIPPAGRKGNQFWLIRGMVNGQRLEFSTRTRDQGQAQHFVELLERAIAGSPGFRSQRAAVAVLNMQMAALAGRVVELEQQLAAHDARIAGLERQAARRRLQPSSVGRSEPLLSLQEVARRLGVSIKTVRRRIAETGIRGPRIGREMMLTESDLARLLEILRRRARPYVKPELYGLGLDTYMRDHYLISCNEGDET